MADKTISINRAPVLTLWGAVVAERLGYDRHTALTLGKALAGLTSQTKGQRLGIFMPPKLAPGEKPKKAGLGEDQWIELCGRSLPAKKTKDGIRAVIKSKPITPEAVEKYLAQKFGDQLETVREALEDLANSLDKGELAARAYRLYEQFRPEIAAGQRGWGQKGTLDLDLLRGMAKRPTRSKGAKGKPR